MGNEKRYQLIVIGGGPAGYSGAIRAAQYGMNVALVESRDVGGTCLNRGCVPTKALLHAAHLFSEIGRAEAFGIEVSGASLNFEKMFAKKDETVQKLREGVTALIKANKIDLIFGVGSVTGENTVSVTAGSGTEIFLADNILIASGSVPALPPIPGAGLPGVLDSDALLASMGTRPASAASDEGSMGTRPASAASDEGLRGGFDSLTIIGGGVIGLEFAGLFSAVGKAVTVIEMAGRILPNMDREIAQNLSLILKKQGVSVHTSTAVENISESGGELLCRCREKDKELSVSAERILIAAGRRPNAAGVLSDSFGIDVSRGIPTDSRFMTKIPGVYAAGDVRAGSTGLAHAAAAEAEAAVAAMAGKPSEINLRAVPACVYTVPEIASVGLSEEEAKAEGLDIKTGKYMMGGNARTLIADGGRGFIKLVFDAADDRLLGAQMMCERATDLIAEAALAVANRMTAKELLASVRPHPTFSEGITEAAESVFGRAIHIMPRR